MDSLPPSKRYSIPPAAIADYLDQYDAAPDDMDATQLVVLARTFERMGCDAQALDCAERAAKLDPTVKEEALQVARKIIGRESKPT